MRTRREAAKASSVIVDKAEVEECKAIQEESSFIPPVRTSAVDVKAPVFKPEHGPAMSDDFERVVEKIFAVNIAGEYNRLMEALSIGAQRTDYTTVNAALDRAEENARKAHQLFVNAKVESKRFLADSEVVTAAMWEEAAKELESEKEVGARRKAITDADVRTRWAKTHPDEFKYMETRQAKVKAMVDSMENLADVWRSRCFSLRTMLDKLHR